MRTSMKLETVLNELIYSDYFVASPAVTPSLGADVIVNGAFAADANWVKGTGWTIGSGVASHAAGSASNLAENVLTLGSWYQIDWTVTTRSAGSLAILIGSGWSGATKSAAGTFIQTGRAIGDGQIRVNGDASCAASVDNISAKPITLSSLFGAGYPKTGNYLVQVDATLIGDTAAGVFVQADSSLQNFILAYHDGRFVRLDKCVGGTFTNIFSTAVTYSAGATVKIVKNGNDYSVYYAGSQVNSTQTISDAGIVAGLYAGAFSTNASNTLANLTIAAT